MVVPTVKKTVAAIAAIACFKKYLLLPATEKTEMAFLKSRRRNEVGRDVRDRERIGKRMT